MTNRGMCGELIVYRPNLLKFVPRYTVLPLFVLCFTVYMIGFVIPSIHSGISEPSFKVLSSELPTKHIW